LLEDTTILIIVMHSVKGLSNWVTETSTIVALISYNYFRVLNLLGVAIRNTKEES